MLAEPYWSVELAKNSEKRLGFRKRLTSFVKSRFDRRYALAEDVIELRSAVESIPKGFRFVGNEDPDQLRIKLFEAHRLAVEASRAIETILQEEIRLWQAIDAMSEASNRENVIS